MRILFCTGSSARYMAPPRLGDEQINCGPDWLDRDIGGHVTSLGTTLGEYDLATVLTRLPADQQPDAVVCLVDAARRSLPRNLRAFRGPKILLVADTHHLNAPLANMIRYGQSEPFDRVVLLYDRHHWEFFHAAGIGGLHWFPGLTFPHGDAAVAAARASAVREARIAFVGTVGICHTRRTKLLSQLNTHGLPLGVTAGSQREALKYYGASLVGFNASLNGDLNLRVFEILASGSMLLTDELSPAAGLAEVWDPGRELITYASEIEMIERAQYAISNPDEARAVGEAGARWFDANFGEATRRQAFQKLIADGTERPEFALPRRGRPAPGRSVPVDLAVLTTGFEYVQELHRNLDRVTVALDDSVPGEFSRMCATLPRIEVRQGMPARDERVDCLVVGRKNHGASSLVAATHVWCWEAGEGDRVALVQRCSSMGFTLVDAVRLIFSRRRINTHANLGAVALVRLEQRAYNHALLLAREELAKNPKSVDALLVMAEIAQEMGQADVVAAMQARLAVVAPHHPRRHQLLSATPEMIRSRRPQRLLRDAQALYEQRKFTDAIKVANEALRSDGQSGESHALIGGILALQGEMGRALNYLQAAAQLAPDRYERWSELGCALRRSGRSTDALAALLAASALAPAEFEVQLALGEMALTVGHGPIAVEALTEAVRLQPGHSAAERWLEQARRLVERGDYDTPRDLLLSHVEVTRLQGTGVLLERFFPDSDSFLTVRSRTLYEGRVDFGGLHFSLDLPGLPEVARRDVLRRLLAPYPIRRILCVPFFASDFVHGIAAREFTGAPLCTYVMDDQVLHSRAVPSELARRLFAASDLRLAISPEMVTEYSSWFQCSFGLLPPIITTAGDEHPNAWTPTAGSARRCAMVGNIWSAKQFEQLRGFCRSAGLEIDWFGNSKVAWLPQDTNALRDDGIHCRGFLPEAELARRLSGYPFVLLPSGALDGTEDNEWLTRLSLPSRMVFILTKTMTPMLVLGSPWTAAARFVRRFGLGISVPYDVNEARARIEEITARGCREEFLHNARRFASCFLVADAGEWIWQSLAVGKPLLTPFDHLYPECCAVAPEGSDVSLAVEEHSVRPWSAVDSFDGLDNRIPASLAGMSDHAGQGRVLPPHESRQRAESSAGR